jgi:biopolymer transport protein ExbD
MRRRGNSYFDVDKARIEIIPMIDIMMFLLVFFIVITLRMIQGTGIQLDLPSSQTTQELKPTQITIGVQKDGTMYVDGQPYSAESLRSKLEEAKKNSDKLAVILAGDKELSYQNTLKVMDVARSAGIAQVGLAAKAESN